MNEQDLDLRRAVRLIRRLWRVVLIFVLAGVAAAAAYELELVPPFRATALVLLPSAPASTSGTSSTARTITTDARIATSAAVLLPAGRHADPALSLRSLQNMVSADTAAASVLRIQATGSTRRTTERLADAVASQLTIFLATSGSTASQDTVTGLRAEALQIADQYSSVQKQIAAADARIASGETTSASQQDAALVTKLDSQLSSLNLQQNSVKSQIAQAQLQAVATSQGSEVIQRATTATPPSLASRALPVVLGLLGGFLVGSLVVLTWHRRSPRLRMKDDLAEAVGAPVLATLAVSPCRKLGDWLALFETHRSSAIERWGVRRALRELDLLGAGSATLRVIAFADDKAGVAQAAHIAIGAMSAGMSTRFCVEAEGEVLATLRSACARFDAEDAEPRPGLHLSDGPPRRAEPGLCVTAVAVDSHRPSFDERRPGSVAALSVAALSVSAGFASAEELASVAVAAADRGQPIEGIFVANPTPVDRSVGRIVDTAVDPHASRRVGGEATKARGGAS